MSHELGFYRRFERRKFIFLYIGINSVSHNDLLRSSFSEALRKFHNLWHLRLAQLIHHQISKLSYYQGIPLPFRHFSVSVIFCSLGSDLKLFSSLISCCLASPSDPEGDVWVIIAGFRLNIL